ncbi:MAG: hypothetical protein QHJ34_16010 [bacterium]|jgi:hypothetical protein|nr:hypothetical protein [bacterium]
MNAATSDVVAAIMDAVEPLVHEVVGADEEVTRALEAKGRIQLLVNSSFLYRDKSLVKTRQSSKRLVATVTGDPQHPHVDDVQVVDGMDLKKHYSILATPPGTQVATLSDSASAALRAVGDIIFVLIGTMRGIRPMEQPVKARSICTLRLDPSLANEFELAAGACAIKSVLPMEDLLNNVRAALGCGASLSDDDCRAIAGAYDTLLDEAVTEVVIPMGREVDAKDTVLGRIVAALREQTREYESALKVHEEKLEDHQALHEVLRIAYNFSTDALQIVFLFMSMCDLKPLLFWSTVDKQWALHKAFALLPWLALGRKEKVEEYRAIISAARNQAFHHVLPFDTTVEVDLSNVDVRAERMRLFAPYGEKQERGVRLKDQDLADVFAQFSRAKQRPVSTAFWRANLRVMEATTELAGRMLDTLLLIHRWRSGQNAT